jgi:dephospho-CoA kinase
VTASIALRVGLTGGIGSGKSTVASLFRELGAGIVDTDLIARQLTAPGGSAIEAIVSTFGALMVDASGALDRAQMRELAFTDPEAKRRLEGILHPLITGEAERQAAAASAPVTVFDCPQALQIERVMARSGLAAELVTSIIRQQAARTTRRSHADAVLYNANIGLDELRRQVGVLWQESIAPSR